MKTILCLLMVGILGASTVWAADQAPPVPAPVPPSIAAFAQSAALSLQPSQPGFLFYPRDRKEVALAVASAPPDVDAVDVDLRYTDPYGNQLQTAPSPLSLTRADGFRGVLELPSDPGYYDVAYGLFIRGGGTAVAGAEGRFSFAVIPEVAAPGKDPHSPFGVNTHFSQGWPPEVGAIVKKAGIAWIRDDYNGNG